MAVFEVIPGILDLLILEKPNHSGPLDRFFGQRRCPNRDCWAHVFVVFKRDFSIERTYPRSMVDFKKDQIPERIARTFSDALACQADGLFVPAAIMIRRTLEELCEDRQATGDNLKLRIASLRTKVVLPNELFDALDDLRLLGNDAAHVEAKSYDSVGSDEVAVAVELTTEVLKAVYQFDGLLQKLRSLKRP